MKTELSYPKNLKYPELEYNKLVSILKQLKPYFDLESIHPCQIHYLSHQQTNIQGQPHNQIYLTKNGLIRAHSVENVSGLDKLVKVDFCLELYPNDCNDSHIETATKRAIKEVLLNS